MSEEHEQEYVDELARELFRTASYFAEQFKVAHGLDQDPRKIETYLNSDIDYKEIADDLDSILEETRSVLPEALNHDSDDEERFYRHLKAYDREPEIPSNKGWRELHSEQELLDLERTENEGTDYRVLLRSMIDAHTLLLRAKEYDEELEELLPEIEGDDAEILE